MHVWKSLPFWTMILIAGRLAIPGELYEASSVDGATGWQKFRFITWPSMRTLYLTSTILSMIWTLGDFNSVYLLTGGGPADLTHVLATLGIRYLRLDQVDLAMATIVVRAAAGAAARLLHDEAAVEMSRSREGVDRGQAAADRHPGRAVDADPDLPHVPVRDLDARTGAFSGELWPEHPTLRQFGIVFQREALLPRSTSGGSSGTRC